jgi:hypothetical protein
MACQWRATLDGLQPRREVSRVPPARAQHRQQKLAKQGRPRLEEPRKTVPDDLDTPVNSASFDYFLAGSFT